MKTHTNILMTTLLGAACLLGLAAWQAPPASAQSARPVEVRVVVVNVERLLLDSARARAATARLEAEFAPRREKAQAQLRQLREMHEKLTHDAPGLSDREQLLRGRELGELERSLRRTQAEIADDFAERQASERAALADRIHEIVQGLPRQLGVDLVLTRTAWHRGAIDVTDKVAAMLDR